jgi:hypothetical protein
MAGEDYTPPGGSHIFTVPKYDEAADAPQAFKDFAASIDGGIGSGVDFPADREGQVVQSPDGVGWAAGMALTVVDAVPADTDGEIGDVVFVTGPGDGGSPSGGGKVLQVVRSVDDEKLNRTLTAKSFTDVPKMSVTIAPKSASSAIMIIATAALRVWGSTDNINSASVRIVDQNDNPVSGAENVEIGLHRITGSGNRESRHDLSVFAYDSPATTSPVTYRLQAVCEVDADSVAFRNDRATGQLLAIEVSA